MKLSSGPWCVEVEDSESYRGWVGSSGLSQVGRELFLDGSGASRKEEATLCSVIAEDDLKVQGHPLCVLVTL